MNLHNALKDAAIGCAASLGLPLGWEGDVFVSPGTPYLKGRIVYDQEESAGIGADSFTRVDGFMELVVAVMADTAGAESGAISLARAVTRNFPRGRGIVCDGGEAVFTTPGVRALASDGARIRVSAHLPFYAILHGEKL